MIKMLTVLGTRPEVIKFAPVIKEALEHPDIIDCKICSTGQHREMLDQVLDVFSIKPHYELNVMKPSQGLVEVAYGVLMGLKSVLDEEKPEWIFVQGDTTTAAIASLAAFYSGIKVGHIEAGLRSYNKYSPFPEEINRKIADMVSDLYFAPTELSKRNLINEGYAEQKTFVTGNTGIDSLLWIIEKLKDKPVQIRELQTMNWAKRMILVTGHRRESFGEDFKSICKAILQISKLYPDINIVYPVHLNPNVRGPVNEILSNFPNIYLIEPQNYEEFVYLMKHSYIILTDSGGVQEEAPSLNKPVLVMRKVTERIEGIEAGTAKLVGTDIDSIVENIKLLMEDDIEYSKMAHSQNPYGDGKAAKRIINALISQ